MTLLTLPLTPLTLQLTPLTPLILQLTPLTLQLTQLTQLTIIQTGSSTDVHIFTNIHISHRYTHQRLHVYHTMWVDRTTTQDVTAQSGAGDRCLGHVQGQRWCSTWHQGANRRQSVGRLGDEGGRTATGSKNVALRATEKTEHDRGRGRSVVQGSAGTGIPDSPRLRRPADPQSHVWLALGRGPSTKVLN